MRRVVIIEDEPDVANLLARHFAGEGFSVTTARDGRAGLDAVHRYSPHLVILDLLLPEVNGWEVCRRLKCNLATHEVPVIIVSAIGSPSDRIALLELGVDDFIVKPCSIKEVIARARVVLRRAERVGGPGRGRGEADADGNHLDS
jgi:two-component system phosphate regulon response regulator PhoB